MTKITIAGIATGLVLLLSTLVWLGPVVVGVILGVILMITLVTLLLIAGGPSTTTTSTAANTLLTKIRDNWKAVARAAAILVGCHLLVWYFWPGAWSGLASNFVFWLDHIVLLVTFLFFREKNKKGKLEFVAGTGLVLTILVIGNVWMTAWATIGWYESYQQQTEAQAIAERQQAIAAEEAAQAALPKKFEVIAPVGNWSEKIPTLHGEMLVYHGPVFIQTDNLQVVERDNIATNNRIALTRTNWIRVKSRTMEAVKVTVYR